MYKVSLENTYIILVSIDEDFLDLFDVVWRKNITHMFLETFFCHLNTYRVSIVSQESFFEDVLEDFVGALFVQVLVDHDWFKPWIFIIYYEFINF